MIFRKVGARYQVSRITGLHYNFLGIEFSVSHVEYLRLSI